MYSESRQFDNWDDREDRGNPLIDRGIVIDIVKKRWWVLGILAIVSLAAAYVVSTLFVSRVATSHATIKYAPLPAPPGPRVYSPPSIHDCARLATSTSVMRRVIETHNLKATPVELATCFAVATSHDNSVLEVQFAWPEEAQAITFMNSFADILVEEVEQTRRRTISVRKRHVRDLFRRAAKRVDEVRGQLKEYERQATESASEQGTGRDQLTGLVERVRAAEAALDAASLRRATLDVRYQQVSGVVAKLASELKQTRLRLREEQLNDRMRQFTPGSQQFRRLESLSASIEEFASDSNGIAEYAEWASELESLAVGMLGELDEAATAPLTTKEARLNADLSQLRRLEADRLALDAEISTLTKRRDIARDQARDVVSQATGVSPASLRALEEEYEQVESERRGIRMQMNSLEQIEEYGIPEMSVFSRATYETTTIESNRKKLFVMVLAGCCAALILPVLGGELLWRSNHPLSRISQRWRLPILGQGVFESVVVSENVVTNESPIRGLNLLAIRLQKAITHDDRKATADRQQLLQVFDQVLRLPHSASPDVADEALQLLVRQMPKEPADGIGKVVMFSGLDHDESPLSLVRQLAKFLAKRGEKVLVIDTLKSTTNAVLADAGQETENGGLPLPDAFQTDAGSGEFVDILTAGDMALAPESAAICGLERILEQCRTSYSMILVAGPSTNRPADVELLAPLADGTVFTVNRKSLRGRYGGEVVDGLLACGARIIGFVG